ncbi:MAG: efflux RND transporter periplasmic adaptor subunit [Muribaculaceae bacterium]|nr:efflux RND transporter periplasmic adaptor subunit [Muribaculaceae bacterium]
MSRSSSLTRFTSCAIAALALAACGNSDADKAPDTVEELPVVEIDFARSQDVPQQKEYTANVEAYNVNNISPSAPNRIKTIAVEVGDPVRRGQTLVTLDPANTDQLKINLDQIEREYNRALRLLEIGGGTQQSVDQLKAQFDAARTQYANAMENTILTSPVSGVVTARNYDPGDMTASMPVLTVGQLSPVVKVIINATESDLTKITRGKQVSITFDAIPDETFAGTVARVYPSVDPATRTFEAEIQIKNPGERLRPGMFARVEIDHGAINRVVVPDRAVVKQTGSGNRYVYVLHGDRVSYNRVELGRRIADTYEILSGVSDGDTVIVAGQSRLADGIPVEILSRN